MNREKEKEERKIILVFKNVKGKIIFFFLLNKGITYIKYSKASEAARACEEMHGQPLNERLSTSKPLEVFITPRRSDINKDYTPGDNIYRLMQHLFVAFSPRFSNSQVKSYFEVSERIFFCLQKAFSTRFLKINEYYLFHEEIWPSNQSIHHNEQGN